MIEARRSPMALARGFTLIEVMVVLVLVTIISIGSFALLDSFQATDSALASRAAQMRSLSMAMYRLDDDFRQVTARPVKNGYTGFEPALRGDADEIEFTRLGAANLTGDPRGELQRLGYSLGFPEEPEAISGEETGGLLLRSRWRVLDRAPDSEAVAEPLLDGIENLAFRYYDGDTEAWLDQWPPVGTATTTGAPDSRLPRAVEIRITTLGAGELRRVYALPEAPVAGLSASAGGGTDADGEPDPEPGDTGVEDSERDREAPAEDGGRREDADAS